MTLPRQAKATLSAIHSLRLLLLLLAFVSAFVAPLLLDAAPPGWWAERGVTDPVKEPNDYAAANQGQVKFIAQQAMQEMNAHLPGGVNVPTGADLALLLNTLAHPSAATNDYAPVNLGQLKAVAKPFYELLIGVGYTHAYPWTGHEAQANDYSIANIGQVKNLFSFDLTAVTATNDLDHDGLPDWWERYYFPATYPGAGFDPNAVAARGDGLTILQAFEEGLNPNDFYNGQTPALAIVSGNNQTALPGSFVPLPLVIQVSDAHGAPVGNAPVVFSVGPGGGQLQLASETSPKTTLAVLTDATGRAKVYFQAPNTPNTPCTVSAGTPAGSHPVQAAFAEASNGNTGPANPSPSDDPDNPVEPQTVPTQSYACLDVSGDSTSADIDNVALNDANQVTFGYGTGTAPEGFDGYEQYHWRTWQNGQPGAEQTIDCFVPSEDEFGNAVYDVTGVYYLTGAGQAYGRSYPDSAEIPGYYPTAISMYRAGSGRFELPNPPFMNRGERTSGVTAISQGGVIAGSGEDSVGFDLEHPENNLCSPGFVCQDGHYTLFDGQGDYSHADFSSGVTLVGETIYPSLVNDEGWVVGSDETWLLTKLWDGQSVRTIEASFGVEAPSGLNNQGQVVLRSWSSFGWGGSTQEGSLWEHGTRTTLVDHVPAALRGKITNIQPFAISNQAVPGSDATIHLLATATVNGAAGTLVITRDNEGTWSYAQIQPPDGTSISRYISINSSGVVAFIGTVSNASSTNPSNNVQTNGNSTARRRITINAGSTSEPSPSPPSTGTLHAGIMNPPTVSIAATTYETGWNDGFVSPTNNSGGKLYGPGFFVAAVIKQMMGHTITLNIVQDFQATLAKTYTDNSYAYFQTKLIKGNANGFLADGSPPGITNITFLNTPNFVTCVFHDNPGISVSAQERYCISKLEYNGVAIDYIKLIIDGQEQKPATKVTWSFKIELDFSRGRNAKLSDPLEAGNPRIDSTPPSQTWTDNDPSNEPYKPVDGKANQPDTEVSPRTPIFYDYANDPTNWFAFPVGNNMANQFYPSHTK